MCCAFECRWNANKSTSQEKDQLRGVPIFQIKLLSSGVSGIDENWKHEKWEILDTFQHPFLPMLSPHFDKAPS